jgi:Ni,Fe-hydrogenase III large subunit
MSGLEIFNGKAFPLSAVPVLPEAGARTVALAARDEGHRLAAMFAAPAPAPDHVRVHLVTAEDVEGVLRIHAFDVARKEGRFRSLTPDWTEAHLFEREIAERYGLRPEGHPWLKPVRGEPPVDGPDLFAPPEGARTRLDAYPFLRAEGEEIHEVGVGPVHAGIIEPGHFRFLCHGEKVYHLEISLGYQHRGVERLLDGGPDRRSLVLAESIAGDTVIGHAYTYCRLLDALAGILVSARAMAIRGIALELERCANHIGDLGALANDVGFLPASAWYGALRGEFLNLLMDLSGNRYGRGLVRPGGVAFDLTADMATDFVTRLRNAAGNFDRISGVLFRKPSVSARFEGTGVVPREVAEDLGLVGPPARASGCERDVRVDFAHGVYRFAHIPIASATAGDVAARAQVRRTETERSIEFLIERISNLPPGPPLIEVPPLAPEHGCVILSETWRGETVHIAFTDGRGKFARYKVIDPSFHNWTGLAMAMRGEEISDFPLCNKSFNLSYAGHDL